MNWGDEVEARKELHVPPDGTTVTAMTWGNEDEEIKPRKVKGVLTSRYVAVFGCRQYCVGNVQVDPRTIVDDDNTDE